MTEFVIDEEDEDEINEFIHIPDEVMETVEAVARQKGIGMGEMMKLIFVQWYEQQSHGGNRLHLLGWREIPADPIFYRAATEPPFSWCLGCQPPSTFGCAGFLGTRISAR